MIQFDGVHNFSEWVGEKQNHQLRLGSFTNSQGFLKTCPSPEAINVSPCNEPGWFQKPPNRTKFFFWVGNLGGAVWYLIFSLNCGGV